MTEKPRLIVDIVSDFVCPWCYVGLHSYKAAEVALAGEFAIAPRFRAYQLNPDTPAQGVDRHESGVQVCWLGRTGRCLRGS